MQWTCHVRRHCFIPVLPNIWLLQSLASSVTVLCYGRVWYRCPVDTLFSALDEWWVSALTTIDYTKKLFWWGMSTGLIYGHREVNLEGSLILCPLAKWYLVDPLSLCTPQTDLWYQTYISFSGVGLKCCKKVVGHCCNGYATIALVGISCYASHYCRSLMMTFLLQKTSWHLLLLQKLARRQEASWLMPTIFFRVHWPKCVLSSASCGGGFWPFRSGGQPRTMVIDGIVLGILGHQLC